MSELTTRIIIQDKFEYNILFEKFNEEEIRNYQKWIYSRFHSVCKKKMDNKLNSEWVARHYLATKMILSATIMVSSLDYCINKNVKISVPYLSYYSILTCCRAVIFTLPDVKWNNDTFIQMNHSKIANEIKNCIMKLDRDYAEKMYEYINLYKDYRELFSYKFPATGIRDDQEKNYSYDKTVELSRALCELAQLNSAEIERYIIKNCLNDIDEWKEMDNEYLKYCFAYLIEDKNIKIIDDEDMYRINYIRRKQPFPVSLYYTMTEGMVEDFFGAWCSESEDDTMYNPDIDWRIIFPIP